jgi:hypothetical protein
MEIVIVVAMVPTMEKKMMVKEMVFVKEESDFSR